MEVRIVGNIAESFNSPLFNGLSPENRSAILSCIGYHISSYKKGQTVVFEQERIIHIGILLSGTVDMVKEDFWGNKTMLMRIHKDDLFGETFVCGDNTLSVVSFIVSKDAQILFIPFNKAMHTCSKACEFHHQLTENMVRIIARKNLDLMRKVEVISRKTLREKILCYLSIQSQQHESRYFEIPLGRVEWAEYLCADRSALTRELAKMKDDGIIDYDGNCFRLL